MAELLIAVIVVCCAVKTVGYGIYTLKQKNIPGSIMIFLMSAASLAALLVLM